MQQPSAKPSAMGLSFSVRCLLLFRTILNLMAKFDSCTSFNGGQHSPATSTRRHLHHRRRRRRRRCAAFHLDQEILLRSFFFMLLLYILFFNLIALEPLAFEIWLSWQFTHFHFCSPPFFAVSLLLFIYFYFNSFAANNIRTNKWMIFFAPFYWLPLFYSFVGLVGRGRCCELQERPQRCNLRHRIFRQKLFICAHFISNVDGWRLVGWCMAADVPVCEMM